MGADTSAMRQIESLDSALRDIESKLSSLEHIHVHEDRSICQDDSVVVSGKLLRSNPRIRLTVGPILGLVSSTFARILLETDKDAVITLNFFVIDETTKRSRIVFRKSFDIEGQRPCTVEIGDLVPLTEYIVYISGVDARDILSHYTTVRTLSDDDREFHLLLAHYERVDALVPGEATMRQSMELVVLGEKIFRRCDSSADPPAFSVAVPTTSDSSAASAQASVPQHQPHNDVCYVIHNGDFLSVDNLLKSRALEILDLLLRDDSGSESWESQLGILEQELRAHYRRVLSAPDTRNLLRRCGNIFLAGAGESALQTFLILVGDIKQTPLPALPATSSFSPSSALGQNEEGNEQAAAAAVTVEENAETDADPQTDPIIMEARALVRGHAEEDIRRLLCGAILRMARRIHAEYLRQLWDELVPSAMERELALELTHLAYLRTVKALLAKLSMQRTLEITMRKITDEFGDDHPASKKVLQRSQSLDDDVKRTRESLESIVEDLRMHGFSAPEQETQICIRLTPALGFVFVDTAWGALDRIGLVNPFWISNRSLPLYSSPERSFPRMLDGTPRVILTTEDWKEPTAQRPTAAVASTGDETIASAAATAAATVVSSSSDMKQDGADMTRRHTIIQKIHLSKDLEATSLRKFSNERMTLMTEDTLKYVVVVCPSCFLADDQDPGLFSIASGYFFPAAFHRKLLLRSLSRWQRNSRDKCALVAHAYPAAAGYGTFIPHRLDDDDDDDGVVEEKRLASSYIPSDDKRARIRHLALGRMNERFYPHEEYNDPISKAIEEGKRGSQEQFPSSGVDPRTLTQYTSVIETRAPRSGGSFWDAHAIPSPPLKDISPLCASFSARCLWDSSTTASLILGPIVGHITASTARVLLELQQRGRVTLSCVDQVTGTEHTCTRFVSAHRPSVFTFDGLVDGRPYDLMLFKQAGDIDGVRGIITRGSFTTPLSPSHSINVSCVYDDKAVRRDLYDQARRKDGNEFSSPSHEKGIINRDDSDTNAHAFGTGLSGHGVSIFVLGAMLTGSHRVSGDDLDDTYSEYSPTQYRDARTSSQDGIRLCKLLKESFSRPLGSPELVIHTASPVDISGAVTEAMSLLHRAESLENAVYSDSTREFSPANFYWDSTREFQAGSSTSPTISSVEIANALFSAEEVIRSAYRLQWGKGTFCNGLLSHASHLFVGAPYLDLLAAAGVKSLRELAANTSEYCVAQLLKIVDKLSREYQTSLWSPLADLSPLSSTRERSPLHVTMDSVLFLLGGKVAVFSLHIRTIAAQDRRSPLLIGEDLIPTHQLQELKSLLLTDPSARRDLRTFVLATPLPILTSDPILAQYSYPPGEAGMGFSIEETLTILDLLAQWLSEDDGRHHDDNEGYGERPKKKEVIIITGGYGAGFSATIEVTSSSTATRGWAKPQQKQQQNVSTATRRKTHEVGSDSDDKILHTSTHDFVPYIEKERENGKPQESSSEALTDEFVAAASSITSSALVADAVSTSVAASNEVTESSRHVITQLYCGPIMGQNVSGGVAGGACEASVSISSAQFHYHLTRSPLVVGAHCGILDLAAAETASGGGGGGSEESGNCALCDTQAIEERLYDQRRYHLGSIAAASSAPLARAWIQVESYLEGAYTDALLVAYRVDENDNEDNEVTDSLTKKTELGETHGMTRDSNAENISKATRLACERSKSVFTEVHKSCTEKMQHGFPVYGGTAAVDWALHCVTAVLQKMSPGAASVCGLPTSFVILQLWRKAVVDAARSVPQDGDTDALLKTLAACSSQSYAALGRSVASEIVCANLSSDADFFYKFVAQLMEAQVLMEHFSYVHGVVDSWR